MRTLTVLLGLLTFSATSTVAQPVTITFVPLGGAVPFGGAYSGVGVGAAAELSARYHFGSWSAGIGFHATAHGNTDIGRDFGVGTGFLEARYGDEFSERSLQAGKRFFPYARVRLGYAQRERRVSDSLVLTADGLEVYPAVGFQKWITDDIAIDVSGGVPLAEFNGDFGGALIIQAGLVIGL